VPQDHAGGHVAPEAAEASLYAPQTRVAAGRARVRGGDRRGQKEPRQQIRRECRRLDITREAERQAEVAAIAAAGVRAFAIVQPRQELSVISESVRDG